MSVESNAAALSAPLPHGKDHSLEAVRVKTGDCIRLVLPAVSILVTIAVDVLVKRTPLQVVTKAPYLLYFLGISLLVYLVYAAAALASPKRREAALYMAPFYTMLFQLLDALNLITAKYALLPVIYFPAPDRILQVFVKEWSLLLSCIGYSYSLLAISWVIGVTLGISTGAWLGFSKRADYWIWPFVKAIGPIPPVAWIPIALVVFPTMYTGSVFLIVLSIWFPTASLTLSGIRNVEKSYFEVAETLGASKWQQIFKVAIPAAMPDIFMGVFTGTCMSFVVLVTAEMMGAKYGLGWYVNWQKEMMAYANVYAGLILIAGSFCFFMSLMMRLRNKVLAWQKGVIKW